MVTRSRTSDAVQALDASLNEDLEALRRDGLFRPLRVLESAQGPEVDIAGRAVISLSSNNSLGLNTHPRLVEAASRAALEWGAGTGAVRTIAGTQTLHEELERRLAAFKRTEAALTFQSGYGVNVGVIDVGALITHRFALDDIDAAIALMKSGQCGKVTLTPE